MCIPKIEHAYEHIVESCDARLKELYPAGVPEEVQTRYESELHYLKESNYVDDFEIYRQINEEGTKTAQYLLHRGTVSGSILIYLLGCSLINPMKPHYYCKKCGHIEFVDTRLFGMDLPSISCPICKETLTGDGFDLPIESVWGSDGKKMISFDYNISPDFFPFIKRRLKKIYPDNEVVNYGISCVKGTSDTFNPEAIEFLLSGFVILPKGKLVDDYPEIMSYLEDGDPCITGLSNTMEQYNFKRIMLYPSDEIADLMKLQIKSGIYANEIGLSELRELKYYDLCNSQSMTHPEKMILSEEKPTYFYEIVGYTAMTHNSTWKNGTKPDSWYYDTKEEIFHDPDFQKFPCFTREDFFRALLSCGLNSDDAFHFSEVIRKGRASKEPAFDTLPIPDALKNVAKMYRYVFPKAHCIDYVLLYARMTYYLKWNSRIYHSVIGKKE